MWNWATWSWSLLGKLLDASWWLGWSLPQVSRGGPGALNAQHHVPGHCPPTHPTSRQLWKARRLEGRGSGDWSESPCQGEWKEKKNHFLLNQWCPTVQPRALSLFTFVLKVAQRIQLSTFFITAHVLLPHSPKPVVFSTLHRQRHPFHLSNYIHFQTDVLWQSYKALTSLFLINEILP